MSRIYEIFGTNAHAMTRALMESAGAACKIPSGASVALKPNHPRRRPVRRHRVSA